MPDRPKKSYDHIYDIVRQIPRGKVATYGDVAEQCGWINHSRLVGYALHNLPPNSGIPWHRVINSQGKISISNLYGLADFQRHLLAKEGIAFTNDRIDFTKYGWIRRGNRSTNHESAQRSRWQKRTSL